MCADFLNLGAELKKLEKGGIEYLHVDIMDGEFVQNYTLGTDFVKKLHEATNIPLDIHMMVVKPELKLDWFEIREGDYVSVHYEAVTHLQALLAKIHTKGGKTMLAINPGTPISVMELRNCGRTFNIGSLHARYASENSIPCSERSYPPRMEDPDYSQGPGRQSVVSWLPWPLPSHMEECRWLSRL